MAKQTLPTNFKDDILSSSMGGKRKYRIIDNGDGTYSFEDVTEYTQTGSDFGAGQMNATNKAVNESCDKADVIDDLDDIAANQADGKIAGAKAVATLNEDLEDKLTWTMIRDVSGGGFGTQSIDLSKYRELMLTISPYSTSDASENSRVLASTIIPVSLLNNVLGKTDPVGVYQVSYDSSASGVRMFGGMNYVSENTVQIRASGSGVKTTLWAR